ncbi:MAG: DUF4838 domain-containing protein, partial [Phycisphaerae bacterium]|nr:DUF4838 domain-containing protein [Phycisphaerae bacterium]
MGTIEVHRVGSERPILFAAAELRKYLGRLTGGKVKTKVCKSYDPSLSGLWLGSFAMFPQTAKRRQLDSEFDDEIYIEVGRAGGVILGANPRSVLLAVYRYLTELGFRWVRPGRDGEFIPSLRDPFRKCVSVKEKPSFRHRCVCIEGAVSWEHVRDMIDWMPKLGFNSYFVQFRESYQFFVRWYHHEHNPRLKKERFTVGDARRFTSRIWEMAGKRGLIIHMMGHGWTCEPFGVPGLGWMKEKKPAPQRIRRHLAKVNGVRDWWQGVALNTQLCYSNPKTRKIMVNAVADYAQEHPQVPIVCFVFADGFNNHCECPRCRQHLPSDMYVKICNEIDVELTRRNLSTKITFDLYADCLWPPRRERLKNPDRFILIFAPITRTYTHSLKTGMRGRYRIRPFVRNRLELPTNIGKNLAFLRRWQRIFKGDSFLFDYHLMWDHIKDPGHHRLAETLREDIDQLQGLGLNGLISCQVQRCFLPTSLIMTTMGRALWDRKLSFEEIANDL